VHVDDAASATVLAVEQKATGVYNIVDDEPAPVREWLPYLAECFGAKPPRRVVVNPDKLGHLGPVGDPWAVARDVQRARRSDHRLRPE
jgi:nucleoside-diphosphate-sugar epimerase